MNSPGNKANNNPRQFVSRYNMEQIVSRDGRGARGAYPCPQFFPAGGVGPSTGKSRALVRDPISGMMIAPPFGSSNSFIKVNPYTKTSALVGAAPGVTAVSDGACYAANSKTIVLAPSGASMIAPRDYNPATDTLSANYTGTSLGAGVNKFAGMLWASNGLCYAIPSTSAVCMWADPVAKTFASFGALGAGTFKCIGGALALTEEIWCAPYNSNVVVVINTRFNTVRTLAWNLTALSGNVSTSQRWTGAGVTEEGYIIFFPYAAENYVIIDPTNDSIVDLIKADNYASKYGGSGLVYNPGIASLYANFAGGCPTPNGKYISMPRFLDAAGLADQLWRQPTEFDPYTRVARKLAPQSNMSTEYTAADSFPWLAQGCPAEDGIYYVPYSADRVQFIYTEDQYTPQMLNPPEDISRLSSSVYNRFMNRGY